VLERSKSRQLYFKLEILKRHRVKPFDGTVVCLRAMIDPPRPGFDVAEDGWGELLFRSFHVEGFQCSHLDLCKEPHIGEVAKALEKYMSAFEIDASQIGVDIKLGTALTRRSTAAAQDG